MHRPIILFLALMASSALAGPYIPAGDLALRHDIQRLADYGIITGPISTWPLAWGPILNDIRSADATNLPPGVADAGLEQLHLLRDHADTLAQIAQLYVAKVHAAEADRAR